jgi:putative colanic acid biosynthesis acetyltransferase WcaF
MTDILEKNDPYQEPSFSLGNRVLRTLWNLTYLLLFRFSPRPFHGWRAFLLKCFGAKLGRHCHVYPRSRIWAPWNLVLGDFSGFADDVNCYNMATVTLGKRVVVSQGVHLCTGTHDQESPNFQLIAKPIMLGDRAWLCAE